MSDSADLTLSITRVIDAPRHQVWRCWTESDLLKQWHVPKPWRLADADLEVRPGGRFNTVMAGPNGERMENVGSFLDVVHGESLVFTDAYAEGFIPQPQHFMTGFVELDDTDDGRTRMVWGARHSTAETKQRHLDMGFETGWNAAADQLNALVKQL